MRENTGSRQTQILAIVVAFALLPICGVVFVWQQASIKPVPVHRSVLDVHESYGIDNEPVGADRPEDPPRAVSDGFSSRRSIVQGVGGDEPLQHEHELASLLPEAMKALADARQLLVSDRSATGVDHSEANARFNMVTKTTTKRASAARGPADADSEQAAARINSNTGVDPPTQINSNSGAANPDRVLGLIDLDKANAFRPTNPWFSKSGTGMLLLVCCSCFDLHVAGTAHQTRLLVPRTLLS